MKIGFDVGGVISKYPNEFKRIISSFNYENESSSGHGIIDLYIISDIFPIDYTWQMLVKNGISYYFDKKNVHSANYEKYGNMAKAVLIKELNLDIFVDDFDGYLQWDSSLGTQPLLLRVMPDAFKPYWSDDWRCDGEFGRKRAPNFTEL